MKKFTILTLLLTLLISCTEKTEFGKPNIDVQNISSDFSKWWKYQYDDIVLSSNFIPIDDSSNLISVDQFFKDLISGNFIPIKLDSKDNSTYYQLFKLGSNSDEEIKRVIKNISQVYYSHYLMEGEKFPEFNFTDLDGDTYTNENTSGKTVILKCWFIKCQACVAEFPELNELVEKYKNRNDIVFLSLAFDKEEDLKKFLINKPFSYKVASVKKEFFDNELKINAYPTHIIIDNDGIIEKVVNNSKELLLELSGEGILNSNITSDVPPPPVPMKSANVPPPPPAPMKSTNVPPPPPSPMKKN